MLAPRADTRLVYGASIPFLRRCGFSTWTTRRMLFGPLYAFRLKQGPLVDSTETESCISNLPASEQRTRRCSCAETEGCHVASLRAVCSCRAFRTSKPHCAPSARGPPSPGSSSLAVTYYADPPIARSTASACARKVPLVHGAPYFDVFLSKTDP